MSITLIIILVTTGISLYAFSNNDALNKAMFNPYDVRHRNQWYRVISHGFVHANFLHLLLNMYVLYSFGSAVERVFTDKTFFNLLFPNIEFWGAFRGQLNYVMLYMGGLLFATVPSYRKHSHNPAYNSLGASGAVSGVVLALIILLPVSEMGIIFLPIQFPAFVGGILYLVYEYYMNKKGGTGVAHDAHLWGALFGVFFMLALNFRFLTSFFEQVVYYLQNLLS